MQKITEPLTADYQHIYLQFATRQAGNAALGNLTDNGAGVDIAAPTAVKSLYNLRVTRARHLKSQNSLKIYK